MFIPFKIVEHVYKTPAKSEGLHFLTITLVVQKEVTCFLCLWLGLLLKQQDSNMNHHRVMTMSIAVPVAISMTMNTTIARGKWL